MKRAGHLFEQVASFASLIAAARLAARGKPPTRDSDAFLTNVESEALRLVDELDADTWRPGPYRTFSVHDPKPRLVSAAPFCDRVVHHALCAVLAPVLERYAIDRSYACRPGKGTLAALRMAERLTRRHERFLKLDVRRYFDSVDHAVLLAELGRKVKDRRVLGLVGRILAAGSPGIPEGKGLPIGNLTSQHFANFYLTGLDRHVTQDLRLGSYVRYMDDMLVFHDDAAVLQGAEAAIATFLRARLRLELRPDATRRGPVHVGVPFLGFRVFRGTTRLDSARVRRLRRHLRAADRMDEADAARRMASVCAWADFGDTVRLRQSFFSRREDRTAPNG